MRIIGGMSRLNAILAESKIYQYDIIMQNGAKTQDAFILIQERLVL